MEIRGIQPADYAIVDRLLGSLGGSKKHLGQQAAKLRQDKNYQPILEIVSEEDGKITGSASLHEITVNNVVCLMMGPALEVNGKTAELISTLKQRAFQSGYRFIVWQQFDKLDPAKFGFKPAADYHLYLSGEQGGDEKLYVYQLVKDSLNDISGEVEFSSE